jgi:hypothetical protein
MSSQPVYCRCCGRPITGTSYDNLGPESVCEDCFADSQTSLGLRERDRRYKRNLPATAIPRAWRARLIGGVADQARANTFLGAARESQTSSRASRPAGTASGRSSFLKQKSAAPST